jgi:menaquinone-dependent protoporphyrinogen oxidase
MTATNVLVTYGSKRGGTAEIAVAIAGSLRTQGFAVTCLRASEVRALAAFDAVVVGGALYAGRWVREARRFVARHARALRARPVWMFSSGPLDDSAQRTALAPTRAVAALMARIGAKGHATFGGRLAADATGFPAAAMARSHAGDWRAWDQIAAWSEALGQALRADAAPSPSVEQAPRRLLAPLCWLVGITAVLGGALLVARPDGSLLRASPGLLAHTPFATFEIPGLLLVLVVGTVHLAAGWSVAYGTRHARAVAVAAGSVLLVWILAEMALLRTAHALQLGYLGVALVVLVEALRLHRDRAPA